MSVAIHRIAYRGWPNCYQLTNGEVDLVVTSDVGPRVMRYGFVDGKNLFYECTAQLGNTGEPWWMIRGGHRLWVAPETVPETYALDNVPVEASVLSDNTISLLGGVEAETKLRKEMTITLEEDGRVKAVHRIENAGDQTVTWAAWAATLLAPGGRAFMAFPKQGSLQPTHPLVMWEYTDFRDPRWQFSKRYLALQQDPNAEDGQKTGLFNEDTFAAYLLGTDLFAKRSRAIPGVTYADFHCSFEVFTNRDFMELETLGPLTELAPGVSMIHVEHWSLHRDIAIPEWTDEGLDAVRALIS